MGMVSKVSLPVAAALIVVVLAAPLSETARYALYLIVATVATATAWYGLHRHSPRRRLGWVLLLVGLTFQYVGDVVWVVLHPVLGMETYPGIDDALYVCVYLFWPLGVLHFARTEIARRDASAGLDALIVTIGLAVPSAVFLILPAFADSTMTLSGKLITAFYPLGDVFLVAVVFRLLVAPGGRTVAAQLTTLALFAVFVADSLFNAFLLTAPNLAATAPVDVVYLAAYMLMAAAACHPSMVTMAEARLLPPPRMGRGRLIALTAALTLPGLTLVLEGLQKDDTAWRTLGIGSILMSVLVYLRMAGLLRKVERQAAQLAGLARSDPLTGAPNRRSWDHELSRAIAEADAAGRPLAVAMVDMDNFKLYNDSHGHQGGDLLLREAVAAWVSALGTAGFLARYGGEEFALLLPGSTAEQGREIVQSLQALTPAGQTFSAGVASWYPGVGASDVVAAADAALYEAKRLGRARVELAAESVPVA